MSRVALQMGLSWLATMNELPALGLVTDWPFKGTLPLAAADYAAVSIAKATDQVRGRSVAGRGARAELELFASTVLFLTGKNVRS